MTSTETHRSEGRTTAKGLEPRRGRAQGRGRAIGARQGLAPRRVGRAWINGREVGGADPRYHARRARPAPRRRPARRGLRRGLASAGAPHAPHRPQAACADRLPLDTLLRVPAGPRRPRPLILALHGARQSGYGLQSYTGFTDDAPGYLVAYPNTPHHNGFWDPDDVPALLAARRRHRALRAGHRGERRRVLQRRADGQRAGLPRAPADPGHRARCRGL